MAARAIWKGVIRFGTVEVPVKLYSAVQDRSVHFRLLEAEDRVPVKQRMVDPERQEPVAYEEVRRGYEAERGVFVVLDPEELAELEPEPSRDIEVTQFVEPARINHQWYDRPYYLGPDGDDEAYFTLVEALRKEGTEGVAHWTMRKKDYSGALRVEGDHLMLITLRHANEVVPASALPRPSGRDLGSKEVRMAEQLIAALESDWEPEAFRDEYRDRVLELIEAKAEGKTIPLRAPARREEAASLENALAESLASLKQERKSA